MRNEVQSPIPIGSHVLCLLFRRRTNMGQHDSKFCKLWLVQYVCAKNQLVALRSSLYHGSFCPACLFLRPTTCVVSCSYTIPCCIYSLVTLKQSHCMVWPASYGHRPSPIKEDRWQHSTFTLLRHHQIFGTCLRRQGPYCYCAVLAAQTESTQLKNGCSQAWYVMSDFLHLKSGPGLSSLPGPREKAFGRFEALEGVVEI